MNTQVREWSLVSTALGATIAFSLSVGIMTFGVSEGFVQWLEKWQTLISAVTALVSALIAVMYIQRQIDLARSQEAERRERAHYADRAMMPAALADLAAFAAEGLNVLKAVPRPEDDADIINTPAGWKPSPMPRFPSNAVAVLRACIETADIGPRKEIAKVLADLQLCNSRLGDLVDTLDRPSQRIKVITSHNMHTYFADYIEFSRRCDLMFDYARGEQSQIVIAISLGDMTSSAFHRGLESYPGLTKALVRRYGEGATKS